MIRPLLVLALLPFAACRGGDLASLESDNLGLQAEVDELTTRLEAMELALAETQVAQQTSDSDIAALAVDVDALDAEVDAQVGLDLPQLLDEVSTNVDRLDALESAGLATELWVVEQGYGAQVDVQAALAGVDANTQSIVEVDGALGLAGIARQELSAALQAESDARSALEGTTTSLAANLGQTQSAVSGLDTQLATLDGSVGELSTGQGLLREDLDETTTRVEDLEDTVGDMASELASVGEDVSQVQEALAEVDSRVESVQDSLLEQGDALAAVETRADEVDSGLEELDRSTSRLGSELDSLDGQVSELQEQNSLFESGLSVLQEQSSSVQGELSVLGGELSSVSADASLALSVTSELRSEVRDVQEAIGTLRSDQEFLLEELSSLDGTVSGVSGAASDNTDRIDLVENELLDTLVGLDDLHADLSALGDEVSMNAATPRTVHRVVGRGNDGRDDGFLTGRELTFTKASDDSELRVSWQDVRRCVGYCYGYWEAYIDGEPCVEPAPIRWWNHAYGGSGGVRNNNHIPATITGYCSVTRSGPIAAGEHTLTVRVNHVGGESSDWYAGWNDSPFVLEAEEVL
ncbi:MAG: chromosome segregation ATPase [Myxococcota bacterium]|jgi:chromosome segregation ATPase